MSAVQSGRASTTNGIVSAYETPSFTPGERAVLDFAEHVTRIFEHHVPAAVFNALRESFTEEQILQLSWAVIAINSWNRLMITFRVPPAGQK